MTKAQGKTITGVTVKELNKVRGFYVLIPCDHCKESGKVPGPRPDRNGEIFNCPICCGNKTVRKIITLEELRTLILGPIGINQ